MKKLNSKRENRETQDGGGRVSVVQSLARPVR